MPLRHAGQYYDSETGIFYNYFRDYDPVTGRYVQSDPIGLNGGLNTYGYVGGNSLSLVDQQGLKYKKVCDKCSRLAGVARTLLMSYIPYYRNIKCTHKCGNILLGGQGVTFLGTITLNYDELHEGDLLAFATTLAHELRHCKEGRLSLSYWGSTDPDRWSYNPAHGALDDQASIDADIILGPLREKAKECPNCSVN